MKIEILLLKIFTILLSISVLLFLIMVIPDETDFTKLGILTPFVISIYVSSIPFFTAIYNTFKLLIQIEKGNTFSKDSVKILKSIKYCSYIFSSIYILQIPLMYYIAYQDDAPGILLIILILGFTPLVIGISISILKRIVKENIKK
jgi:hypothetical protein